MPIGSMLRASGLTWEQAQGLPDSELMGVLDGHRARHPRARIVPPYRLFWECES